MTTATRSALHTPICDLLGIRYPICQAGMGYVARSALAAAVSEAGGLGVIAAANLHPTRAARGDPDACATTPTGRSAWTSSSRA